MTPAPTLQELIDGVREDAAGDESLELLAQALATVTELERTGDALLGHFVDQCRRSGHSWSEISSALGVSKQAAHKRFTFDPPTFQRFTERARIVLEQSEGEARRSGHGFVGTEHFLLALLEVKDGLAARVLGGAGITKTMVEAEVLKLIPPGAESDEGKLPFTPRAKAVLRGAVEEALRLGHNYVGTEHILLGLLRDEEAVAAKVLVSLGANYEVLRTQVIELLGALGGDPTEAA